MKSNAKGRGGTRRRKSSAKGVQTEEEEEENLWAKRKVGEGDEGRRREEKTDLS